MQIFTQGLVTVAFSSTPIFDCSLGDTFLMTLTGNVISSTMVNAVTGRFYTFIIKQDGVGPHSFVWPVSFKGVVPITLTSVASTASIQIVTFDGTNFYAQALGLTNL